MWRHRRSELRGGNALRGEDSSLVKLPSSYSAPPDRPGGAHTNGAMALFNSRRALVFLRQDFGILPDRSQGNTELGCHLSDSQEASNILSK